MRQVNKTMLNHILQEELINKNEDIVSKRIVNGDKKSNELILIFKLTEKATNVHDTLMKWLLKCLDTNSDKVRRYNQYEWNIISQIKDNNYQKDYDEELDEDSKKNTNTIMVAIHITNNSWLSFNNYGLAIPYNYSPPITFSPQNIMDCLLNEPPFIKKIGVSNVYSEVMMQQWAEIISTEPNGLDYAEKDYMVHPMWMKTPEHLNPSGMI